MLVSSPIKLSQLFRGEVRNGSQYRPFFYLAVLLIVFCPGIWAQDYFVGGGDLLKISVYDHPDLETTVRVGGEGAINVPLLGQVKVNGMTVAQISSKLAELYSDGYLVDPQIGVFIEEYRSKKAFVLGEVNKPGLHELRGSTTMLEVLSTAGGLTKNAGIYATVKRKTDAGEKVFRFNIQKLVEGEDTSLNIPVMDGDSIYISKAEVFFVSGEVENPDQYNYDKELTVIQAITIAGGFTDIASKSGVKIIRKIDGKEVVLKKVKMDELILPNDVIVVPESFF